MFRTISIKSSKGDFKGLRMCKQVCKVVTLGLEFLVETLRVIGASLGRIFYILLGTYTVDNKLNKSPEAPLYFTQWPFGPMTDFLKKIMEGLLELD